MSDDEPQQRVQLNRGTTEGADCERCPFSRFGMPNRPVVSEYPDDPAFLVVGEGPGHNEVFQGRPFVGQSGQIVNKVLAKISRPRSQVYVGNATCCIPPAGSPENERERAAECCRPRLMAELAMFPGKPILTLGAVAARTIIPRETLDAIDPPETPKALKKAQKHRQQPTIKAALARRKSINKIRDRRLKHLIDHHRKRLITEVKVKYRRRPDEKWLTQEVNRVHGKLVIKAQQDAIKEFDLKKREREAKAKVKAANPTKKAKPKRIKLNDIVGTLFDVDCDGSGVRPIIPGIHPAALLRGGGASIGGSHTPDLAFVNLIYDAAKVNSLANGRDIRLKLNVEYETADQARIVDLFMQVYRAALAEGACSLDLETYVDDPDRHSALMAYVAKIRVIGLATSEMSVSVAWDLLPGWCHSLLQLLIGQVEMTYHNGLYDQTVLTAYGFVLGTSWFDTLLAHHAAFPGVSHKLQTVTAQFFGVTPWKCLRGDVEVLLPNRSTMPIQELVRTKHPVVLSVENGEIKEKRVTGWHKVHVPGQEWLSVRTARCDAKYRRGLIVTPDHRVMTERGLVEAQELMPGVDRIAIDEPAFSADQISVAVGTLLGDSTLHVSRVFHQRPWDAPRASIRGANIVEGLRDCKVAALPFGTSGRIVAAHTRVHAGVTLNASTSYAYGTKWAFQYMDIAKLVYDVNWKRRIKPEGLGALGARGLAMMFMDDGDLRRKGGFVGAGFATNGFPIEDVELFTQWIRERYGDAQIYTSNGPYCSLSARATRNMLEDLRGFIHPSMAYKTIYDDAYIPPARGFGPHHVAITDVVSVPRESTKSGRCGAAQRRLQDHRYCITVEDTKLFFTNYGLVSNSEFRNAEEDATSLAIYNAKDTGSTHALRSPLQIWVKRTDTERVYELDKKMSRAATQMHLAGMPVSREVNSELLATFSKQVKESRAAVEDVAADKKLREQIWHHLAIQQARKQRKIDPPDFEDRYQSRLTQIKEDPDWKWKIGSGKHIAALLQAMSVPLTATTEGGDISTKKDVLETLTDVPVIRDILNYREADKLYSTFVWGIFDRVDPKTGEILCYGYADENNRIHPIWNVHRISGRWSSQWPVVSNVPKDKWKKLAELATKLILDAQTGEVAQKIIDTITAKGSLMFPFEGLNYRLNKDASLSQMTRPNLRRQIRARKGRKLVGFDFAQIEARVIALISGDPYLCRIFAEKLDPHIENSRIIWPQFDTLDKDTQKQLREQSKPIGYGAMYLAQVETLHKTMLKDGHNVKLVDVAKAYNKLMTAMAGLVKWQSATIAKASQPPYEIRDFVLGRRRNWPLGQVEGTEAVNFGVQTAAASIMNTGMARIMDVIHEWRDALAIAQIHDAAVFEVWEDDAEPFSRVVKSCFEQAYDRDGRTIEFTIDLKIADDWSKV